MKTSWTFFLSALALALLQNVIPIRAADRQARLSVLAPTTVCVAELSGSSVNEIGRLLAASEFGPLFQVLSKHATEQEILITVDLPFTSKQAVAQLHVAKSDKVNLGELNTALAGLGFTSMVENGSFYSLGLWQDFEQHQGVAIHDAPSPDRAKQFADAFDSIRESDIKIAVLPPEYLRRTLREVMPELPKQLGGGPSSLLTDGMLWASIGVSLPSLDVQVRVQSADEQSASEFAESFPNLLLSTSRSAQQVVSIPLEATTEFALSRAEITASGSTVNIIFNAMEVLGKNGESATAALQSLLQPAYARQKSKAFKQMMLAIHNYFSANKYFPLAPHHRNKDGSAGLSWRVHILPFIGENDLYNAFQLDEPWDSEHNIKLLDRMPALYSNPEMFLAGDEKVKEGHTVYVGIVGEKTIMRPQRPTKIQDVTDGTSNTIMLVEVKPELAVPWTAPQDYEFDPDNPASGLGVGPDGQFGCAAADGSAHRFPGDIDAALLKALFEMNEGTVTRFP